MEMRGTWDQRHSQLGWLGLAEWVWLGRVWGPLKRPPKAVKLGYRAVWCGSTWPHRATECLPSVTHFHSTPEIAFGLSHISTSWHH